MFFSVFINAESAKIGRLVGADGFARSIITICDFPSGVVDGSRTQIYLSDSIVKVANPMACGLILRAGS